MKWIGLVKVSLASVLPTYYYQHIHDVSVYEILGNFLFFIFFFGSIYICYGKHMNSIAAEKISNKIASIDKLLKASGLELVYCHMATLSPCDVQFLIFDMKHVDPSFNGRRGGFKGIPSSITYDYLRKGITDNSYLFKLKHMTDKILLENDVRDTKRNTI